LQAVRRTSSLDAPIMLLTGHGVCLCSWPRRWVVVSEYSMSFCALFWFQCLPRIRWLAPSYQRGWTIFLLKQPDSFESYFLSAMAMEIYKNVCNGSQEKDHISPCQIYVMNCVMDNFGKIDGWGVESDLAILVVWQSAVYTMKFNPQGTAIASGSHDKDICKSSCISFELVTYCGSWGLPIKTMLIDHCAGRSASGLLHGLQKFYVSQFWNR
jgi:hypothetical protein